MSEPEANDAPDGDLDTPARRSPWGVVAKVVVTVALLALVFYKADFDALLPKLKAAGWWAPLGWATALLLITPVATLRWAIILRHLGHPRPIGMLWQQTVIGTFFNQFLPTSIGGDVIKAWYLKRGGVPTGVAIVSVLLDRALGFLTLILIVAVGIPAYSAGLIELDPLLVALACTATFAALVAGLTMDRWARIPLLHRPMVRLAQVVPKGRNIGRQLLNASMSSRTLLLAWPWGAIAILLSVVMQAAVAGVVVSIADTLSLGIEYRAVFYLFPLVQILSMVPVSVGGWGVREGAMVVLFGLVGTPLADALAVSLVFGICNVLSALPGGALWLTHRR